MNELRLFGTIIQQELFCSWTNFRSALCIHSYTIVGNYMQYIHLSNIYWGAIIPNHLNPFSLYSRLRLSVWEAALLLGWSCGEDRCFRKLKSLRPSHTWRRCGIYAQRYAGGTAKSSTPLGISGNSYKHTQKQFFLTHNYMQLNILK